MEAEAQPVGTTKTMRGLNVVVLSGNVGSIKFDKTRERNDEVCTFMLAIEKSKGLVTWVRVNVYGGMVTDCRNYLSKGKRVEVVGELMNRFSYNKEDTLTEVRCIEVKFIKD